MPIVSRSTMYIKNKEGKVEDFIRVISYDVKGKLFYTTLPKLWADALGYKNISARTVDELESLWRDTLKKYEQLMTSMRKVIIYKFTSKAELAITKQGVLTKDVWHNPDFDHIVFKTDWGREYGMSGDGTALDIYYVVCNETTSPLEKEKSYITDGGHHVCSGNDKELKVMDWSLEREAFFRNFDMELTLLIYKLANFLNGDVAGMAKLIDTCKNYNALPAPPMPKTLKQQETT